MKKLCAASPSLMTIASLTTLRVLRASSPSALADSAENSGTPSTADVRNRPTGDPYGGDSR